MDIEISKQEALARLADGDSLMCRYEVVPNDGITRWNFIPRDNVLLCIKRAPRVFESGPLAQLDNVGLYIHAFMSVPILRAALLFLPTKPECRLSKAQLQESLKRGRGADIFSLQIKN